MAWPIFDHSLLIKPTLSTLPDFKEEITNPSLYTIVSFHASILHLNKSALFSTSPFPHLAIIGIWGCTCTCTCQLIDIHYGVIISGAYGSLPFPQKNLSCQIDLYQMTTLSVIRSQLSYCSPAYKPDLIKKIVKLERV